MEQRVFSTNGARTTGYPQAKKWKQDRDPQPFTELTQTGPQT